MLTIKGWLTVGIAAAFLAQTGGLLVQGGQFRKTKTELAELKHYLKAQTQRAVVAEAAVRKAEATGAVQAQEAAIVCQGEGATLFNRGRQVGIAIGRSQCPAS